MKHAIGILGGMGPLASAYFLKTLYEANLTDVEGEPPRCVLYSDPTFPDRTDAIRSGCEERFVGRLVDALDALCRTGVGKLVIACVTSHYYVPSLPHYLRKRLMSLVDIIVEEILATRERYLLLCSDGTREGRVFERHERWSLVAARVAIPSDEDQVMVQRCIYRLKRNVMEDSLGARLGLLGDKYRADILVAGCTEFHILTRRLRGSGASGVRFLDPLLVLARDLKRFGADGVPS
jgi:aspartate racemase